MLRIGCRMKTPQKGQQRHGEAIWSWAVRTQQIHVASMQLAKGMTCGSWQQVTLGSKIWMTTRLMRGSCMRVPTCKSPSGMQAMTHLLIEAIKSQHILILCTCFHVQVLHKLDVGARVSFRIPCCSNLRPPPARSMKRLGSAVL